MTLQFISVNRFTSNDIAHKQQMNIQQIAEKPQQQHCEGTFCQFQQNQH